MTVNELMALVGSDEALEYLDNMRELGMADCYTDKECEEQLETMHYYAEKIKTLLGI